MVKFYSKANDCSHRGGEKYFNKISSFIEKIGKQNFILILFVLLILGITGLYQTFSLFTSSEGVSMLDGIKTLKFVLGSDNTENSITIASGSSKNIAVTVSNHDKINLKYGVYYSSTDDLSNVELGYLSYSEYPGTGTISPNSDFVVTIKIYNNSSTDITIQFGITYGLENGGDLILESNQKLLDIIYPYKYEVEYLESNGTQYIDTGISPSNLSIKTELQYQYMSNLGTGYDSIMGSRENNDMNTRYYVTSLFGTTDERHILGNGLFKTTNDLVKHTIIFNDEEHNYYLDGTLINNLGTDFVPHNQSIYLFGLNTEGTFSYQSAARIYYCKIWDNGTLVRDYIPVIDREGVPCLYDKVNNEFYYNMDAEGVDFATNYTPYEVKVSRNTELTEANLRTINSIPDSMSISNIEIKDSSNAVIESVLSNYDIYTVTFNLNNRNTKQTIITKPSASMTLTNKLNNAGFESELTNYYNASPSRSTSVKRSGSYSMYYTCNNNQAFLRIKYGDIGAKDHSVYVRVYSMTDNSSLSPLLYVHEDETFDDWCNKAERYSRWFTNGSTYNKWAMWSQVTNPTSQNYSYFTLQISQGNTTGVGNVYWDDFMAIVLGSEWDSIPTTAWMDKMIPDFTGTQTFSW